MQYVAILPDRGTVKMLLQNSVAFVGFYPNGFRSTEKL